MLHEEFYPLLPSFAAGDLEAKQTRSVGDHVAGCDDCSEWMRSHDLLAAGLAAGDVDAESPGTHLSSAEMAKLAAEAAEAAGAAAHIDACASCSAELVMVRAAIAEARPADLPFWSLARLGALGAMGNGPRRLAWAAAAVVLIAAAIVWLQPAGQEEAPLVAGAVLSGVRTIESASAVTLEDITIATDADITVRSLELVALGEGFALDSNATFSVVEKTDV